jgi:hypothetical protein
VTCEAYGEVPRTLTRRRSVGRKSQKRIATVALGAVGSPGEPKRLAIRICSLRAGPQVSLRCRGPMSRRSSFLFGYIERSAPRCVKHSIPCNLPFIARPPAPKRQTGRHQDPGPIASYKVNKNQIVKIAGRPMVASPGGPWYKARLLFLSSIQVCDHVASLPSYGQGPQNR